MAPLDPVEMNAITMENNKRRIFIRKECERKLSKRGERMKESSFENSPG